MPQPVMTVRPIGDEAQPLVAIDDFAPDPDALRATAIATPFGTAAHYYPGTRAPLPAEYWRAQQPIVDVALAKAFGPQARARLIDASFSLVTRAGAALTLKQRLPHCDAFAPERIALIHYLSPDEACGTAFFRHRSTGYETVDEGRAPSYQARLAAELRDGPPPRGYVADSTQLFERTALGEARYNRAYLYRSFLLHSGAITPDATLSPDPAKGRLTVTAFFLLE